MSTSKKPFDLSDWTSRIKRSGGSLMTRVFELQSEADQDVAIFSAFVPNSEVESALSQPSWDYCIGNGAPGCSATMGMHGPEDVVYHRYGGDSIEPLVLLRDFHGLKPDYFEVAEEFRLLHNLYHEPRANRFLYFDESGEESTAVQYREDRNNRRWSVDINTKLLRQYAGLKRMHLALFFEVTRHSADTLEELGLEEDEVRIQDDLLHIEQHYGAQAFPCSSRKSYSRLIGKKFLPGFSRESCGIWPFETEDLFESFIIGTDGNCGDVVFSCNPDNLANYFGANPESPHFLTPVHFRPEVLTKYTNQPEKYRVEDGRVVCGGLWSLRIDNHLSDRVVVFLGDLGQSLSHNEQLYWKSFNIQPSGPAFSDVTWKRGFLAEFADPTKPDLLFRQYYEAFGRRWREEMGWDLYVQLAPRDAYILNSLHIPATEDQSEFDEQVLWLTKLLVDSLDEKGLDRLMLQLGVDPSSVNHLKGEGKSIQKLEALLGQSGVDDPRASVKVLRDLQALRSASSAHRKGPHYQRLVDEHNIDERGLKETFSRILTEGSSLLILLSETFLSSGRSGGSS